MPCEPRLVRAAANSPFRVLDAARIQCYFRARGGEWKIDRRLRGMVTFRRGDLSRDRFPEAQSELHGMDLIVCRNVFIYLEPEVVASITAKFADTLAEGGYLMTGHSELFGHPIGVLRTRASSGEPAVVPTQARHWNPVRHFHHQVKLLA